MASDSRTDPRTFIECRLHGTGLTCALFYFERGADLYGWWIGPHASRYYSAYFQLENFFSSGSTQFYATGGMDLYGGWRFLYSARTAALDKPVPVDAEVVHELERIQGAFASEWLFFDDDSEATLECLAYERLKLPLRHVNVRSAALDRFVSEGNVWRYRSGHFDTAVLDYLQRHWPLDYREPWQPQRRES